MELKSCSNCRQIKPTSEFGKNTNGLKGKRSTCKICTNADNRARHHRSKDKWAINKKSGWLKRHYGIDLNDYRKMLIEQNNVCAICDKSDSGRITSKMLSVDHCHKTKKVRGLLCSMCNTIIGFIEKRNVNIGNITKYLGDNA